MAGPLSGHRIVEFAGIGPGPFAGMMLADMGAEVIRVDRFPPGPRRAPQGATDVLGRGRRSAAIDLKAAPGRDAAMRLIERADALIEGFRPGVMERLGLGPDDCLTRNPRLVYGRMTGWGQDGPAAGLAGHDINYIALSGTLDLIGRRGEAPVPPVNLIGDFGGGGMLLAFGVVCGLLEAGRSGRGQVVDAAMVDGSAVLAQMIHGFRAGGLWGERGTNLLDTGAWFYDVYETSDHRYMALGALEPPFLREFLELSGLAADVDGRGPVPDAHLRTTWPEMRERVAALVRTRTRDEWAAIFEGSDACFVPVLTAQEAAAHPHNVSRGTFTRAGGVLQASPAPRFSRTPATAGGPAPEPGRDTREVLAAWGFTAEEIGALGSASVIPGT
ncbi:CaiB/BaiF CoA transferase family protein [Pseudosporangium ferrugineum]|uniref:CaiB/BaiF CoA transferase family protein n=1 Tax=Pseudosporangium ferrugineum TaxID=439699 RepID=UPI000D053C52|nr:CaiB/BaiF CoA-transferase family protein [Pseudosporangium ferrugineum]